ncbi:hypothetical protein CPLU01_13053 [Colletotrichum plurivorum]|uniref:Uncharacterized protein n=1 Tax=Colletotrichum plurivorum TaxID=2175906 RepID=A0A8H6JUN1_9PEZI|nr:hypothetical protein CPLU01_13053 [Colletotrichum plurivorum]
MPFDRDQFVHLLTDYYEFCNRVFWHGTVRQAPPGGLTKNDTVIDLLSCVPYVDYPEQDILACTPIIMDHTQIIDYRSEETLEGYVEPYNNGHPPIPPSRACIATCLSRNANEWRACGVNVYRPADFFALCKQRFMELRWIGLGQWHMEALRMNGEWDDDGNEEHWELANKMKEAGWPGDGEGGGWDRAKFEASANQDEAEE